MHTQRIHRQESKSVSKSPSKSPSKPSKPPSKSARSAAESSKLDAGPAKLDAGPANLTGFVAPDAPGKLQTAKISTVVFAPPPPRDEETIQRMAASRMEDEGGPPAPREDLRPSVTQPSAIRPVTRPSVTRRETVKTRAPTVAEIMTKGVQSVAGNASIKDIALLMAGEGIGAVPVVTPDGRLLGIVTDRDIVIRVCAGDKGVDELRASDAMTTDPVGILAGKTVLDALAIMARLQVHRLPVVDDNFHLVGIISTADIANCENCGEDLREALAEISNRRSFWSRIWR